MAKELARVYGCWWGDEWNISAPVSRPGGFPQKRIIWDIFEYALLVVIKCLCKIWNKGRFRKYFMRLSFERHTHNKARGLLQETTLRCVDNDNCDTWTSCGKLDKVLYERAQRRQWEPTRPHLFGITFNVDVDRRAKVLPKNIMYDDHIDQLPMETPWAITHQDVPILSYLRNRSAKRG